MQTFYFSVACSYKLLLANSSEAKVRLPSSRTALLVPAVGRLPALHTPGASELPRAAVGNDFFLYSREKPRSRISLFIES